jgi:hypothetical protein
MPKGPKGEKRPADVIGASCRNGLARLIDPGARRWVKIKNPKAPAVKRQRPLRPSCRRSAKPNKRQKRRLEVAIPNQRIFARLGSRFSLLERVFPFLPGGAGSRRKRSPADLECVMHRTVKTVSVSSFGERLDVRPANRAGSHNWWAPRWPLRSLPMVHRFANPGIMPLRTLRPLTRTPNTERSSRLDHRPWFAVECW